MENILSDAGSEKYAVFIISDKEEREGGQKAAREGGNVG